MIYAAEQVAYQARALAQAHPLTPLATAFLNRTVAKHRANQATPEIGIWAGSALLKGYCVRMVEEEESGFTMRPEPGLPQPELDELDEVTTTIAATLRTGEQAGHDHEPGPAMDDILLANEDRLLDVLDAIVGKEVENRLDHWRDTVTDENWVELEEWITWWVVKGYALRVAEARAGALVRVKA